MKGVELKRIFQKRDISSRLKCPICYEIFQKPRRLYCGHTFCKRCIKQYLKPHKNPQHVHTCPICRIPIDLQNIGCDVIAKTIIDDLRVQCPVTGCHWIGKNKLLETHYKYECSMKKYIESNEKNQQNQDDVADQINRNIQRAPLLARVISKNPHLLNLNKQKQRNYQYLDAIVTQRVYQPCVKTMVSIGIQTIQPPYQLLKGKQQKYKNIPLSRIPKPPSYRQKKQMNSALGRPKAKKNYLYDESSNYLEQQSIVPIINLQKSRANSTIHLSFTADSYL